MLQEPPAVDLSHIECWQLLQAGGIGRLALTAGALPTIVPVRYHTEHERLVVCLGDRTDLAGAVDEAVVAFEADSLSEGATGGWMVHLNGIAALTAPSPFSAVCEHTAAPLVAAITQPIVSGSRYRLCDAEAPPLLPVVLR